MTKRYYLHGDPHETLVGHYYCKRCDAFIPPSHFATCRLGVTVRRGKLVEESNADRYKAQWRLLSHRTDVKQDSNNLFV